MSIAASELQRAVYSTLAGNAALIALLGGPDVFDHTPPSATFPYVTFGQMSVFDWDTATETGHEVLFSLHVWSRAKGRKEAFAIIEKVSELLNDAALNVGAHTLICLRHQETETGYDDDVAVHHGLMRFRAVLEPTE